MIKHRALAIAAVFAMMLTMLGGAGQASAASTKATSNVSGNSYTSPHYGYTLNWNSSWTVSDESAKTGHDLLALDNGSSTVYIEGIDTSGTSDDCLSGMHDQIVSQDGVSNVEPYTDENGDEVSGSSESRAYAVYQFTYSGKNGDADLTEYIDCRPIVAGTSMLVITQLTLASDFNDQIDPLLKLLGNLSISGGGVSNGNGSDTGNSGSSGNATTGSSSSTGSLTAFIKATENDIDSFWAREFPLIVKGGTYKDPANLVTFDKAIKTGGCGSISASDVGQVGPFYCPADNVIYYDLKFAQYQLSQFNNNRSVISVAMAHEIGHHVQELAGWQECSDTPCLDPHEMTSQEIELQADCFAGAWTADAEARGRLGSMDIETNIAQWALLLGDQSGTEFNADPQAHGNGALRTYWLLTGYYKGATECLTASAATDPARYGASIESTPASGNSGDLNTGGTTPTPAAGGNGSGANVAMGNKFSVPLGSASASAAITGTDAQASMAGVDAKGSFLVVYFSVTTGAKSGAFDYTTFTVTDENGKSYQANVDATDALLKTSSDLPNGVKQKLDPNTTYNLAVLFDVPKDASGFTLTTADGSTTVTLDR